MKKEIKNKLIDLTAILTVSYALLSFVNGKVYNDYQEHIERNQATLQAQNYSNEELINENERLKKVANITRNNPLYFPFGLLYDLAEKRL
jgi:hypothetical protein